MYTYRAEILSVYDGDTLTANLDLGMNIFTKVKVRLEGINTPEIRTRDINEKIKGYEARDYLRIMLDLNIGNILIRTVKKGKYGRWIGKIIIESEDGDIDVNKMLVEEGFAVYKDY